MSCDRATNTGWRVTLNEPRVTQGERSLYLRARRMVSGRAQEQRVSTGTMDRTSAEMERARFEAELNTPVMTLPGVMDARLADLEADRTKSEHTRASLRSARIAMASVLNAHVEAIDRAAVLRARDALRAAQPDLSPETINSYLRKAAAAWRWAEDRGLLSRPWPKVKPLAKPPRKKRPYTPSEIVAVLAWVATWQGGRWRGLLGLVDDTGRRCGEVARLMGRDLDRRELTVTVTQKGGTVLVLPVSPETLRWVPEREPEAWLFPRPVRGGGAGPARVDAVRSVVRKAIRAVGIVDGERLDTHSLRRSFTSHAHRAGVPDDVTMRLTGHSTHAMLEHYQRETVGDNLRAAQDTVRAWRECEAGSSPASSLASPDPKRVSHGQSGTRTHDPVLVRGRPGPAQPTQAQGPGASTAREEKGAKRRKRAPFSLGEDAVTALQARWAEECPEAFDDLIESEESRSLWRAARAADGEAHGEAEPAKKGAKRVRSSS